MNVTAQGNEHHDQREQTSPIPKVVVVNKHTTEEKTPVTYSLPSSLDFKIQFCNGDQEGTNGNTIIALDVKLKEKRGEKPRSGGDGTWGGYKCIFQQKIGL